MEQRFRMNTRNFIVGVAACAMLFSMNDALGFYSESFESGTPSIQDFPVLGDSPVVNELRAPNLRERLDGAEPTICMDVFSEGENRNGLAVAGGDVNLILNKDNKWSVLDAAARGNESLYAPSWDASSWIDFILDAGLTNANMDYAWFPSTWAEDGMDERLNDGYLSNIASIPEPATYGLITIFGGGILLFRRRFAL